MIQLHYDTDFSSLQAIGTTNSDQVALYKRKWLDLENQHHLVYHEKNANMTNQETKVNVPSSDSEKESKTDAEAQADRSQVSVLDQNDQKQTDDPKDGSVQQVTTPALVTYGAQTITSSPWMASGYANYTTESSASLDVVSSFPIRIMQWNTLAQTLCTQDSFPSAPFMALQPAFRARRVIHHIASIDPDVICLQEIDNIDDALLGIGFYKRQLSHLAYHLVEYAVKDHGRDGCAIFAKDTFRSGATMKVISKEKIAFTGLGSQVACVVLMELHKENQKASILVSTTHLKSKAQYEAIREAQASYLISYLDANFASTPSIICADLNTVPQDATIQIFKKHGFSSVHEQVFHLRTLATPVSLLSPGRETCGLSQSLHMSDFYTTWKVRDKEVKRIIDYILYRDPVSDDRSKIKTTEEKMDDHQESLLSQWKISRFLLPPESSSVSEGRFPDLNYPSDHVDLVADMNLIVYQASNSNNIKE